MILYRVVIWFCVCFCNLFFRFKIVGAENMPDQGKIIMACNHKSNLDPMFLGASVRNRTLNALAKQELFKNKLTGKFFTCLNMVPIDRDKPDMSSIKKVFKTLKEGTVLGIFPEGHRMKGREFGDAKAGLALFAIKSKSEVVPISIISSYKFFRKVVVYIGEPISLEKYYGKRLSNNDYEKISQEILDVIKENYYKYTAECSIKG